MVVQIVFDLLRGDVLTLANDDVLQPAGDRQITVRIDAAQIAGAKEASVVECLLVERSIEIALADQRAADPDLTHTAGRLTLAVGVEVDPAQREAIAGSLDMTVNALNVAVHRLRQRFRHSLKDEVADTLADPGETEEELRALLAILSD